MSPRTRKLLLGDWHPIIRDPVDLLRATFLLGAVVLLFSGTVGGAVRLVLTMGLVLVPRLLGFPRPFDLALVLGMSLQAWGNVFDLFERWAWYDTLVHFVLTGFAAPTIYLALARLEILPDPSGEHQERWLVGIALITYLIGQGVDAIYEMYEYAVDLLLPANLNKGLQDTILDMVAAGAGAALGGVSLAVWTARGWGTRRVPGERLPETVDRSLEQRG